MKSDNRAGDADPLTAVVASIREGDVAFSKRSFFSILKSARIGKFMKGRPGKTVQICDVIDGFSWLHRVVDILYCTVQ